MPEETAHSAYGWSLHEYGFANFNDERLTKRGIDIGAHMLQHPQQTIPKYYGGNWAPIKATYRFFANKKVQSKNMLEAHQKQMHQRAAKCQTLLYAHDTSALNLSAIKKMQGKGSIGGGTSTGLFLHPGLIIDPQGGIPLGLGSFELYARDPKTQTEEYKKKAVKLPITEKETGRWIRAITEGAKILDKHIVFISDRESDIYEVFQEVKRVGQDAIIRASKNRLLEEIDPQGKQRKLFDKILEGEIITTYETDVPIDHHKTRKTQLTIRKSTITLLPSLRQKGQEGITVTVLNVMEENPPEEYEPIHWRLTTTLPVTNAEEAQIVVQWYIYRWRIERFFYTLKTGAFNVEKLQFETFENFSKALTMYAITACRILFTLYYEREHPLEDATTIFSADEVVILCLKKNKQPYQMTIHEAVVATAKLGGYLARKNDGPPGIKALWIGFQTLNNLVDGMLLGKKLHLLN